METRISSSSNKLMIFNIYGTDGLSAVKCYTAIATEARLATNIYKEIWEPSLSLVWQKMFTIVCKNSKNLPAVLVATIKSSTSLPASSSSDHSYTTSTILHWPWWIVQRFVHGYSQVTYHGLSTDHIPMLIHRPPSWICPHPPTKACMIQWFTVVLTNAVYKIRTQENFVIVWPSALHLDSYHAKREV